ncbi:response regulator [Ensifer soli]|uniref:response regulator n=1 Tax=Ciceribacter sp. sgz301302 TaxID=3342379 RepID=UPI0035BB4C4D
MSARLKRKLLIVDDDGVDVRFVVRAFSEVTHEVAITHADDADAATLMLDSQDFDYVLLDINMPGISGVDLLRRIRDNKRTAVLPVIMFTSSMSQIDIYRSYENGANAYALKPSSVTGYRRFAEGFTRFWVDIAVAPCPPGE